MSVLWFTLCRWSSGAPFQQPFAPDSQPKHQLTWRWNKVLKAEGSAETLEIQGLSFTAGPQPTSVIDTFNKSAQQRCRWRKIHCGPVTALLFRAYKSPRELCFLPEGASQGSAPWGSSCTTCGHKEDLLHPLFVPGRERHFIVQRERHGVTAVAELFINSTFNKQQFSMAWISLVSFLHVGPSPTTLFWPRVPWDVPTTEGRELVQPRAGSQN